MKTVINISISADRIPAKEHGCTRSARTLRKGGIQVIAGAAFFVLSSGIASTTGAATAELDVLKVGHSIVEINDSGELMDHGFDRVAIGENGDVAFRSSRLLEWDPDGGFDNTGGSLSFVSASGTYWTLAAGASEPVPYLSRFLEAPGIDGDYYLNALSTFHGPALDGSVVAPLRLRDADGSQTETFALYRYSEGEYELLMHSDEVPGLAGYVLTPGSIFVRELARNRHGEVAVRVEVDDVDGESTFAWMRGDEGGWETILMWGDPTGVMVNEQSDIDNREYYFEFRFIGEAHTRPVINDQGEVFFYAAAYAEEDEALDLEASLIRGIWRVGAGESAPELFVRAREFFTDQTTGGMRELEDITGNRAFSVNNAGDLALTHRMSDPDGTGLPATELWLKNAEGFHSLARERREAPNLDQVGWNEPDEFRRVGNPALSDTGTLSFFGSIDGGWHWALWVFDGSELFPVVIEGMDAPLEGFYFSEMIEARQAGGQIAPLMNNQDQVVFKAELTRDDESGTVDSIWAYDPDDGLLLIARADTEIEVEGATKLVDWVNEDPVWEVLEGPVTRDLGAVSFPRFNRGDSRAYGPNSGFASPLNDSGEFVFAGNLFGDFSRVQIEEGVTGYVHGQDILLKAQIGGSESVPEETFDQWMANLPPEEQPPVDERGPLDMPAGDGMSNLLKYSLGLAPLLPGREALPKPVLATLDDEEYLSLTIEKNPGAVGVDLAVKVSPNLEDWMSGPEHTAVVKDTDTILTVRDKTPVAESGERFIQLHLTQAEEE